MLSVTTGMILAYCAGYLFAYKWFSLLGCIPPALVLLLMVWMPESPRWYLEKKRKSDALKSLLWLRGTQFGIQEECLATETSLGKKAVNTILHELQIFSLLVLNLFRLKEATCMLPSFGVE